MYRGKWWGREVAPLVAQEDPERMDPSAGKGQEGLGAGAGERGIPGGRGKHAPVVLACSRGFPASCVPKPFCVRVRLTRR